MSQLIRSLTPLRDSSVLITAKELITGLSMDFCFSPSASEESPNTGSSRPKYSGNQTLTSLMYFFGKTFKRFLRQDGKVLLSL